MANGVLFVRGEKLKDQEEKSDDADSTTAEDDIWDDTALIQAYDRAVSLAKEEVTRRLKQNKPSPPDNGGGTPRRRKKKSNKKDVQQWKAGDACRAIYSVDGTLYEATVNVIHQDKATCVVTYIGYDNEEEVPLKMLQSSQGQAARKIQEAAAKQETQEQSSPVQNGVAMECSDGETQFRNFIPIETKSPQGNKMDWESRTVRPQASNFCPPNYRPIRMPPMGMPPMAVPPPPPPHLTTAFPEEDSEALSAMLMSWYMSGFHTGYYQGLKQAKNFPPSAGHYSRTSSRKK